MVGDVADCVMCLACWFVGLVAAWLIGLAAQQQREQRM